MLLAARRAMMGPMGTRRFGSEITRYKAIKHTQIVNGGTDPALAQWYRFTTPTNGLITRSLSPFEQSATTSLFAHPVKKMTKKAQSLVFDVMPGLVFCYLVKVWGESYFEKEVFTHRH